MANPVKKKTLSNPPNKIQKTISDSFEISERTVWAVLALTGVVVFYWLFHSPRPYDDDSINRYFMAQAALEKPDLFLNFWGRPLAILFFALPAQAGYWYCAALTAFLTIGTCYFVYKAAVAAGFKNAWLAIVFTIAQPFFFITSFSLSTEPLAAFFLAWGLFLFYRKKSIGAALVLSMVPLARSELVLILPIFAWLLFKEKKYIPILLLGTGLLLYQIAGMLATGDILYLLSASKSFTGGLYANGPFDHYFQRFIFISGPIIFVFLLLRLAHDVKNKEINIINFSVIITLATHVYLYWKGDVAHAGFLRHFAAISPVMALIALQGYNIWSDNDLGKNRFFNAAVLAGTTVLILVYYSVELFGSFSIVNPATGQTSPEYSKFLLALLLLFFFIINKYLNIQNKETKLIMMVAVIAGSCWYTFSKEKPLQLSPEQQTVRNCYEYFNANVKTKVEKTMVAHSWFFFYDNYNFYTKPDSGGPYVEMRKEKLEALPIGGIVLWDSHYSWRLSSNVQQEDLVNNPNFKLQQQFVSNDRRFVIYVFEKIKS
jgi:hypothetical protein